MVLLTAALLVGAACGGSDGETTSSTVAVDASLGAGSTSDPRVTAPSATEPPIPAGSEPVSTTPEPGSVTAACLQGGWVMDAPTTSSLIGSLLPGFPLTVEGTMAMTFSGSDVEHFINLVVTFTIPNGSVSGALDQRFAGTYVIDGDVLAITNDSIEGGWSNLTGTVGGVSVDVPVPPSEIPPLTGGPATCVDDVLTVQYTSGLADAVAVFTRT